MTPDELLEWINHQLNEHRRQAEQEITEGQVDRQFTARVYLSDYIIRDTFNNYREFELWCAHYNLECMINGPLQDGAVVGRRWRVQRRVTIPIVQEQVAHFAWRDHPIALQDGDELTIDYPALAAEHIAQRIDYELTEVFHRPNMDTVYIGLDGRGRPRPIEGGYGHQGGYIVPQDIAAHILSQHEDTRPEEIEYVDGIDDVHSFLEPSDFRKVAQGA